MRNYSKNENVLAINDMDECVLLNMDNGNFYGIDEVGSEIWKLLDLSDEKKFITNHLIEIYNVEPNKLEQDVSSFLENMEREGLIVTHE